MMDETERQAIRSAVAALDEGMQGMVRWMYTLKPVLRNELLQMTAAQMEKLRQARDRLAGLLGEAQPPT